MRRHVGVTLVLLLGWATAVRASPVQEPATPRPKDAFVASLVRFVAAIAGTYGDEGAEARSSLAEMRRTLAVWDTSISSHVTQVTAEAHEARPARAAELHLGLGVLYLDRGRTDDAVRELRTAAALDPTRADIPRLLGVTEGRGNRDAEAAALLRRATQLDPGHAPTHYLLAARATRLGQPELAARARQAFLDTRRPVLAQPPPSAPVEPLFVQWGLTQESGNAAPFFAPAVYADGFALVRQGRYDEAIVRFEDAVSTDPLTANTAIPPRLAQGIEAFRAGRLPTALDHLRAVLAVTPNHSEAHRVLGTISWVAGQRASGLAQIQTAIRLNPTNERAYTALVDALLAEGRFAEAERALLDAIRVVPGSGHAHFKFGQVETTLEKDAEALGALRAAARLAPVGGLAYLYRAIGDMVSADRDAEALVALYVERVEISPNDADAHLDLGQAYLALDRDNEAQAEFLVALMIDPQHAEAYASLGQTLLRTGAYADAEIAARRAVTIDPGHIEARYTLATSLIRLGRTDEGRQELGQYQQMRTAAETARRTEFAVAGLMRDVTQSLGRRDYAQAAALLERALVLKPGDPALHVSLGLTLGNAGRLLEAVQHFEQALALGAGPEVHRHLADAYTALGRGDDAQRHRMLYENQRAAEPGR
jgi:tetratricopeptide (TPR) repeat protein